MVIHQVLIYVEKSAQRMILRTLVIFQTHCILSLKWKFTLCFGCTSRKV